MLPVRISVIGGNILRSRKDPKGGITKASWAMMRRQGAIYLRYIEAEAPIGRTGTLQRSHVLRVLNPFRAEIVNTATRDGFPYPTAVATGTRPHWPPASSGLPFPVRRHIAQHGTKPNDWFGRGAARGETEIRPNLEKLAADIAREIV